MGQPPANPDQTQQEPNKSPHKPNKIPTKPKKIPKMGKAASKISTGKVLLKQNSALFLPALPTSNQAQTLYLRCLFFIKIQQLIE